MKKLAKFISSVLGFVVLSIFASQCFAQSQSKTADQQKSQISKYVQSIYGILDLLQEYYVDEPDMEALYHGALKGMLEAAGDPYTTYLDADAFRGITDTTEGSFGGVGLSISKPYESTPDKPAFVEVVSPIEDTPGFKAGIQAGDLIVTVDGVDTSTISMDDVLSKLRGKVGEDVEVGFRRGNIDFTKVLTRALIEVPTVKFGTIPSGKKQIGYMKLIQFTPLTAERVQDALDSFDYSKTSGIIIDLRNNPGGLISSVVDVANKFIDDGPIVSTKSRVKFENSVYSATKGKTFQKAKGIPIIVLINKGSASASEILSGALKDNHLAYLVGQRSYGKGSVQQVIPLSATDGIKVTMARYYTPSDVCIDKIGIPPDREVLFPKIEEEAEKQYTELYKKNEIEKYVSSHKNMSEKDIASYAKVLRKTYTEIDEASLRKLVRNEVTKTSGAMLYDLDYDIQLREAIKILEKENFASLVKNAKTLKQLQDAAQLEEKKEESNSKYIDAK